MRSKSQKLKIRSVSLQFSACSSTQSSGQVRNEGVQNQKSEELQFPFTDYCALKPTQQQLNDDYVSVKVQ
jgi:hypothetical protein